MADFPNIEAAPADRGQGFARRFGLPVPLVLSDVLQASIAFSRNAPADPALRHWRQWGARNITGRIRALVQNPRNPAVLLAGSAQGGVFRSADRGATWSPLGSPADCFPVGALALDPSNPSLLYAGSGEPVFQGNVAVAPAGHGFFRFEDGAAAFVSEVRNATPPAPPNGFPAGAANSYARIVVHPASVGRCWIASHTGLWRRSPGPVFALESVSAAGPPGRATDVVLIPGAEPGTHRLLAAFAGAGIFRGAVNADAAQGATWESSALSGFSPSLPAFDRILLAVCSGFPSHVYAVFGGADGAVAAIYHSSNSGDEWTRCAAPPNLFNVAFSSLAIAVHPGNPSVVAVGARNLARSVDSGAHWELILDAANFQTVDRAQHGDIHTLLFDIENNDSLWVAGSGGIIFTPDAVGANPLVARTWRRRSYGLSAAQFHDITVHPDYPFMMGGGLQDSATYFTCGGPTWLLAGIGDGGQMCFEKNDPRRFVCPAHSDTEPHFATKAEIVSPSRMDPAQGPTGTLRVIVRSPMADLQGPENATAAIELTSPSVPAALNGLFVQNALHHPVQADNLILGRVGDLAFSVDGGATYTAAEVPGIAVERVLALAYGPGADATASDWWIGTDKGKILQGTGPLPKTWVVRTPPDMAAVAVTSIAVHPANANYVVAATGGDGAANLQGRVFLSNNAGVNWMDITGLAAAFVLPGPSAGSAAGTRTALPPGPVTRLLFDATVPAAGAQVAFAGTFGGVFVLRNLPPLPGVVPIPLPGDFNPNWLAFNGPATAPLPVTLVNDLELITLPARPGAAAGSPESSARTRLYASMYGRGIFACDLTSYPAAIPAGGPPRRLYIRQHSIEDGLAYPRPTPTLINTAPSAPNYNTPQMGGDPRLPAPAVTLDAQSPSLFSDLAATDIRAAGAAPQPFSDAPDGVEFDEELHTQKLTPGRRNAIFVQIHNAGWDRFAAPVDVHLFFAPATAPAAVVDPEPLPDLPADFWSNFIAEPRLPPSSAPWQRAGLKQTIPAGRLSAANPAVVRFEWSPPASVSGGVAALLAVCTSADDPLPPTTLVAMRALLRQERRAAFRLVECGPLVNDIFIRDDVEDRGRVSGSSFAGRSPDIIVVQTPENDTTFVFRDLFDTHRADRLRTGMDHIVYVRVHNRSDTEVEANVQVFWVKPNAPTEAGDANAPAFDGTKWTSISAVGSVPVTVPAGGWAIARVDWPKATVPSSSPDPAAFNMIGLAAIASAAGDAAPPNTRVTDAASFWQYFGSMADSSNAAFRAVGFAFTFDSPGRVEDFGPPGSPIREAWSAKISEQFRVEIENLENGIPGRRAPLGPGNSQLYNPITTPTTAPSATLAITWGGFPMRHFRPNRDRREAAWIAADVFTPRAERIQDEYLEWFVYRTPGGLIRRVDFTAEAYDYWDFLALHDEDKLLALYREFISSAVVMDDLFGISGGVRVYNRLNRWNTAEGAMHLTNDSNSLGAEINLVAGATVLWQNNGKPVTDPLQLIRCGRFGAEIRSSDPRIGWDVNNLARQGFAITIQPPVGLLIDSLDDSGFLKPDGTPVGNYWRILRGFDGGILRASYEVPEAEGFVVGEITIGGETIRYGGQLAEHVTMKVVGLACRPGHFSNTPLDCSETGPAGFGMVSPPGEGDTAIAMSRIPEGGLA